MSARTRSAIWSTASIPVLPVTWTAPGAMPSARRLARAPSVGAKWKSARRAVRLRFVSSGYGEYGSPVRRPASTCATGMRA